MKAIQLFSLASLGLLTMSNSCEKGTTEDVTPLASGRIVRVETTIDDAGNNPRPRWEVNVTPMSFPGLNGVAYQEIKTFDLPDTAMYKVGSIIQFRYHLVSQEQHTPWRTQYEQFNTAAQTGATAYLSLLLLMGS
jgi:hypothetical protein